MHNKMYQFKVYSLITVNKYTHPYYHQHNQDTINPPSSQSILSNSWPQTTPDLISPYRCIFFQFHINDIISVYSFLSVCFHSACVWDSHIVCLSSLLLFIIKFSVLLVCDYVSIPLLMDIWIVSRLLRMKLL